MKKQPHGGKRRNAGRRAASPLGPGQRVSLRIPAAVVAWLDSLGVRGTVASEIIERAYLDAKKSD